MNGDETIQDGFSRELRVTPPFHADEPAARYEDSFRTPLPVEPLQALDEGDTRPETEPIESRDPVRESLVRQFEQWLDRMAEGEPPPQWLPVELLGDAESDGDGDDADLYTVFSGLTALTGEVRLQGRAFKQLSDLLAPLAQVSGRLDRIESAQSEAARELASLAAPDPVDEALPAGKDVLEVLFDLYDRLERGLRNSEAALSSVAAPAPTGLFARFLTRPPADRSGASAQAMIEGYQFTLKRLDAALTQWGIQRVGLVGQTFDPRHMIAVDVESTDSVPEGTVLEVQRGGYRFHDRVLATARVKVARAATPKTEHRL